MTGRRGAALLARCLTACTAPVPPPGLAAGGPQFNPVAFFTGHVTSWGVEENRAGDPTAIVTTDCTGTPSGPNSIRMVQVLHIGAKPPQTRIWTITQTSPASYAATANDMTGTATGTVTGRAFHLRWVLDASPGNPLAKVTMDQWMYRMDDGAVMIRTVVTKLHVRLLEVSEQFEKS
jgi:hypothetical protein